MQGKNCGTIKHIMGKKTTSGGFLKFAYFRPFLFFLIILFLLPLAVFTAYHLAYLARIYPGITIAGLKVGNLTKDETENLLSQYYSKNHFQSLTLTYEKNTWTLNFPENGIFPQIRSTVAKAFQVGREGPWEKQLMQKWNSFRYGMRLPIEYSIPDRSLEEKIASIAIGIDTPLIEPHLGVLEPGLMGKSGRIIINNGSAGRVLDSEMLKKQILEQLANLDPSPIILPVKTLAVITTDADIELTKKRAENLLDKKLTLTAPDFSSDLGGKAIVSLLDFKGGYDKEKLTEYIKNVSKSVNREPENATFVFDNGKVTVFKPAKDGIAMRQSETVSNLSKKLLNLEATSASGLSYSLSIESMKPAITTESVNTLGIKGSLGKGQSNFKGSIGGRIHNILLASSRLNGILIKPGEIFSFNKALGDVSINTGYQQAYIIKEGRTVLGDGGGVCQVSTTLFRAALNAGLPIVERWAHAYRVSYYEQGYPPGLDATVYDPGYDLKIKNDTPGHILIQTQVDANASSLTFELYGASDDRQSKISKSKIWSETPPPPDLYQDDPTLPTGQVKQVDWKAWGAKVSFDYKVTRNNETLIEKTFYSNYQPWQSVFLKGTKT